MRLFLCMALSKHGLNSQCLYKKYLLFNWEYFAISAIIPHIVIMS
ncbi:hypothetical protein F994_03122 [Acinetobacter bohemicus ANC 3994]|uniref:Uncharacterized protein n=1 Tax=Acinetobacter bohemicus ANC 3994 TaxID=1217715 RepID=N8Q513_9GAMM|nr:hypothetical protein F994_03122 [Acinetobacter bohemicus ANC 3994]